MIFSDRVRLDTGKKLAGLLETAGEAKRLELLRQLAQAEQTEDADTVFAAKWITANSPLSDLANYDFSLFLSCARHGVFLRRHSPYAREVPEDIFLNYVLHIRVNEEELCDCRRFFYDQAASRVEGRSMHDAILELNYWNAEHVTYQATDERTISALGAFSSAYGRCGEESAFGVNVFRAVGIPARQIYTPRWAHCDDNHAWVEVWCDGAWHFLGACEPEEVLNRGWFTNASSRAMVIHSRCFGEISGEEVISRTGMATFLNHLKLYAVTKRLTVRVRDEAGRSVPDAAVSFCILNTSDFYEAATVRTDAEGTAALTCGLGSFLIRVQKDGIFTERLVFTPDTDTVEIVLRREELPRNRWEDFVFRAPRDRIVSGCKPTEEQKALGLRRTADANALRQARVQTMFDPDQARAVTEQYGYSREIYDLLEESRGNFGPLLDFLRDGQFRPAEKQQLLLTLSRKDRRDADPDVLREALALSRAYADSAGEWFYPYVVCPRVHHEPLTRNRAFIRSYFSDEMQASFREDPARIWSWIQREIRFDPSVEYGQIVTCPVGALTVRHASPESKKILFVSICRALGIPARMNPVNGQAEFVHQNHFCPVEAVGEGSCTVVFRKQPGTLWQYGTDFGIARLEDGRWQQLNLWDQPWAGDELRLPVHPGTYRILTDNRLPNGDIHGSQYHLTLSGSETGEVQLRKYGADLREMLDNFRLEEFRVSDAAGNAVSGRELTREKAVLLWLEEGKEPTEHILNEMLDQEADFRALPAQIIFLVRSPEALRNAKIQTVLRTFPGIRAYYDSFVPNVETLAQRMYVDPEKLPLILVTTGELNAVYACSGYNVGSGDLIVKITESF